MRNDIQRSGDGGAVVPIPGRINRINNGIIPNSFKTISSYLKIVSSGASTVASTVRSAASAASAVVERERDGETNHYHVSWVGFDRLELERGITRQVLLLGFSHRFQVWDVEVAENVHNLVSRHDGPVSFVQMLPKPLTSIQSGDKFAESRPLLILCADGSFSGDISVQEAPGIPSNGSIKLSNGSVNGSYEPTTVWFYSLTSQSYVHLLRFRSTVHLVRCTSRVVAVLQSAQPSYNFQQIHCLNSATLEREYTILINPVTTGSYEYSNIGVGPLAVGPRWMAYSGSPVVISNTRCVSSQHLTPSSFHAHASNGSLVAHYARESSKHLAAGIVTLRDIGYKKLTRYYSELLPEGSNSQTGTVRVMMHSIANGHSPDADNVGMVIVRDIVDKNVIAQFRAHKSPIQSLCFDPSGTLLVTASIQGHNINVFRIMPGASPEGPSFPSYVHLYRLQRGFTNAVIQDISFSNDSRWIMISSSRGTSHLFAISPSGGSVSSQSPDARLSSKNESPTSGLQVLTEQTICVSGPPVTLSAVSRIRNGGSNGWQNTVSGAAAAATGRLSSLSGAIASVFHDGNTNPCGGSNSLKKDYYLFVFSPSGCLMQYALRFLSALDDVAAGGSSNNDSDLDNDAGIMVEALQKWNICQKQKQNRKEEGNNVDAYGVNVNLDTRKIYPENLKCSSNFYPDVLCTTAKENIVNEEKLHHMYISEAELQMHQNKNPLWARSEIYFQPMLADGSNINEEDFCGGEIEVERVPTRTLEGRSKGLVPVFDYLQNPMFQRRSLSVLTFTIPIINSGSNGQFKPQGSDVSDVSSLDSIANGGLSENEMENGLDEKGQNDWLSESSRAFLDTNDTPPTVNTNDPETVNTSKNCTRGSQHRFVNSRDGLDMENHFAEGNKFD
ncbi:hypothetical protein CASFOL_019105 [Castilleja foliolosa]|uniref:BCAS3 domain-containing protein n=1 Tax=Castilleja foliolosa TaxID=1961234 RepID=A0ABD3D731_9LAMI